MNWSRIARPTQDSAARKTKARGTETEPKQVETLVPESEVLELRDQLEVARKGREQAEAEVARLKDEIEAANGRVSGTKWDACTLDLDILWYDGEHIDVEGLTVPHPRIRERRFVLAPLVEAVPGIRDNDGPYAIALAGVMEGFVFGVTSRDPI